MFVDFRRENQKGRDQDAAKRRLRFNLLSKIALCNSSGAHSLGIHHFTPGSQWWHAGVAGWRWKERKSRLRWLEGTS